MRLIHPVSVLALSLAFALGQVAAQDRVYANTLKPLVNPAPLLNDHPEFLAPVRETARFEAPPLVMDEGANLSVRAWRFSYNSRGLRCLELNRRNPLPSNSNCCWNSKAQDHRCFNSGCCNSNLK